MTKVATIDTRRLLALLLIAAMLIAMIPIGVALLPSGVLAADNGTVACNFTTNNGAPVVNSIALSGGGTMNPGSAYDITVNITDTNTMDDIDWVTVYLYWDENGTYVDPVTPSANNNTVAVLNWVKASGFALDSGHVGSTWGLTGTPPTMSASIASWVFHVTVSKVAEESLSGAEWHIHADANDGTNPTADNKNEDPNQVSWYGEISVATSSINWGSMATGTDNVQSAAISATYKANGTYDQQVSASATWTGPATIGLNAAGTPGDAQLSIRANDAASEGDAVQVSTSYQSFDSGVMTIEDGNTETSNYLWLTLGDTGIPAGQYTGSVFFKIVNS
jgi:hypothetical protein